VRVWLGFTLALACLTLGCQRGNPRDARIGAPHNFPEPPAPKNEAPGSNVPADVVERGALPFHGFREKDDTALSARDFLDELSEADVICIGENHGNPHDHWAELQILHGLFERTTMNGKDLAVGLEMVDRSRQPILERYRTDEIEEPAFLKEVEWSERWGFDFSYYRPQLVLAKEHQLGMLGLNLPRELSQKLARGGLESLNEKERARLPGDMDLYDEDHRAWFDQAMKGHPPPITDHDNLYLAQVAWDETMAETAARWLRKKVPGRQLVILAGSGHCRTDAIPARLTRRVSAKVFNVKPMIVAEKESPCEKIDGYAYALVMSRED
jgi:uncharacterized iron-regulated protein